MTDLITADDLLEIYEQGSFPMADDGADEDFYIVTPRIRSILPVAALHVSRKLKKTVLDFEFEIRVNSAFAAVIEACAESTAGRPQTWINAPIKAMFEELHARGLAHSVECWREGRLVGGLYGLQLGGAFCGESMFSRETDASKVALVHLAARLHKTGFTLLDAQLPNPHLEQFGQLEIPQADYLHRLKAARALAPDFRHTGVSETNLIYDYFESNNLSN